MERGRKLKKKQNKKEKLILYEAFLHNKYRNCNQEKKEPTGNMIARSRKHFLWISWNLFLYIMTGFAIFMLLNDSTRSVIYELLLHK